MASKASSVSVKTILKVGTVQAPIKLMKATGDSSKQKWEVRPSDPAQVERLEEALEKLRASEAPEATPEEAPAPAGDPLGDDEAPKAEEPSAEQLKAINEAQEALDAARKPRKGVLKEDGAFIDLTDEIEEIGERSKMESMEVVSFIDRGHVPNSRITASYYLAVGDGEEGLLAPAPVLKTLAEGMRAANRYMVVRFSKKKGQTLGIVRAQRDGSLILNELVFFEQWREPGPKCLIHTHVEVPEERVGQAVELIEAMAGRRDSLDSIGDLRAQMEHELAEKALAGEMDEYELPPVDPAADQDADQLGDLLKRAVAEAVA